MVTFAPTSTPPVSSVTLPEILPRFTCGRAAMLNRTSINDAPIARTAARWKYLGILWEFIARSPQVSFDSSAPHEPSCESQCPNRLKHEASLTHVLPGKLYLHPGGQANHRPPRFRNRQVTKDVTNLQT